MPKRVLAWCVDLFRHHRNLDGREELLLLAALLEMVARRLRNLARS